jgi:hypothetical protein
MQMRTQEKVMEKIKNEMNRLMEMNLEFERILFLDKNDYIVGEVNRLQPVPKSIADAEMSDHMRSGLVTSGDH